MRCASPREYYPMLAPTYPSDHNAGHQLAIGRNKMILTGRFCQSLKLSPNKAYQLHSAVLDSRSSPPLDASHFNLVFTTIVKLTNAYGNLFILSTSRKRSVVAHPKKKYNVKQFNKEKSHCTKPLKNNIKLRSNPPLYARDQSFAVNLFPSNLQSPLPPYINPLPPTILSLPPHPLIHRSPTKTKHTLATHPPKKHVLQQHLYRAIPAHQDDLQHQATHWSRLRASGKNLQH